MKEQELKSYQTVQERIKLFYKQYPQGSIITEPVSVDGKTAFKAMGYRNYVEQVNNCPGAVGWSQGINKEGRNFTQFEFEELETSAIGRMIKNMGLVSDQEPAMSQEEADMSAKVNKKTKREDVLKVVENGTDNKPNQ